MRAVSDSLMVLTFDNNLLHSVRMGMGISIALVIHSLDLFAQLIALPNLQDLVQLVDG